MTCVNAQQLGFNLNITYLDFGPGCEGFAQDGFIP